MSKEMIEKEKLNFYDMSLVNQKLSDANHNETIQIDLACHLKNLDYIRELEFQVR